MTHKKLLIGTRGSALALWQADYVKNALAARHPGLQIELRVIRTMGDKILDSPLSRIGDKGLFTREIEQQLLSGGIDLAVHSLKDLPTASPAGLHLAAITVREDPADVLVSKNHLTLAQLPPGATVLSGSLRRQAQLLHRRPDLQVVDVRGNVQTRLRKLDEGDAVAIVMAAAGLIRSGAESRMVERFDPRDFLPACGQGALALQVRSDDADVTALAATLEDPASRTTTTAERATLGYLHGGCQIPVGAYAELREGQLHLRAMIASLDGTRMVTESHCAAVNDAEALGCRVGERLLERGGREILAEILSSNQDITYP